jgi:hypothetical protein
MNVISMAVAALAASFAIGPAAQAATFKLLDPGDDGATGIYMDGRIAPGDNVRLEAMLARHSGIASLWLNSQGGNVKAGLDLAATVVKHHLATAVGSTCSSACMIVFAAGERRIAAVDAHLGVHGVSLESEENTVSRTLTTSLAGVMRNFGAPDSVVAKMVKTESSEITWLIDADISGWVYVFDPATGKQSALGAPIKSPVLWHSRFMQHR